MSSTTTNLNEDGVIRHYAMRIAGFEPIVVEPTKEAAMEAMAL